MHLDQPALPVFRRPGWRTLGDVVLTTDFKQRRCLSVLLVSALVTLVSLGLMAYGATRGLFGARQVAVLAGLCTLNTGSFYVIVRMGLNLRSSEPTLAFPQALVAQTIIAYTYAIAGPLRGATLVMLALVMVFGMFNMRTASLRVACAYTVLLMGAVMAALSASDPLGHRADLEAIHFGVVVTVMTAIALISVQLMTMRSQLKDQKLALQQAMRHIENLATHDELTGLANRRHMMALLNEHALRRARGGPDFYVAVLDLDHFKQVNDSYGHGTGDQALRAFAQQARQTLRTTDIIGRWGGEEFVLLLPETPPGEPTVGIERLRSELAVMAVCSKEPELHIGFSAGFTRYVDGETIDATIERADHALYAAKAAGRNRTVLA